MESITVQKNDNRLATFWQSIHHLNMRLRILLVSVLFTASAWAGIVDNVRIALSQNNFSAAESALNAYRNQQGVTPEYLEAYSWMARAALDQGQYEQAAAYAKQTQTLAVEQMKRRPLDSDTHLPIALGAAIEVQSQVLAQRGQRTQAVALLRAALQTYGTTSIHDRLQKNLNLLSFQGKVAPALKSDEFLGAKLPLPAQTERVARAAVLLGALVLRLQRGSSDHHAAAFGVFRQRTAGDRADAALWIHSAD